MIHAALGQEIRERREKLGLRQVDLARLLHSNQPAIARLERGDESSTDCALEALAALELSPDEIGCMLPELLRLAVLPVRRMSSSAHRPIDE